MVISVSAQALPAAPLALTSLTCVHDVLTFCVPTTAGTTYQVEYADSLPPSNWTVLQTIVGDGSVITLTNKISAAPQRFFRVRAQ